MLHTHLLKTPFIYSAFLVLLAGCSGGGTKLDYGHLDLANVSGKVTLDGVPLAGATVVFEDTQSGRLSHGVTDSEGNYTAMFDNKKAGVLPGSKIVRISMKSFGEEGDSEGSEEETVEKSAISIPKKYNTESELNVQVEKNGSHVFDFPLKSN